MDALIGRLREGVEGVHSVHAYLFCGPAGTGKKSLAEICARALNCTGLPKPCDECGSCVRYLAGTHPDHIVLSRDKPLGVDDVRALIERVSVRPFEGGRHTVVIEKADRMTVQAQNALLKTLEEPPGSAVFFLIADGTAGLLPTVLSRVRLVRFSPLPSDVQENALIHMGFAPERARMLAAASEGSMGKALALNGDESYFALRQRVTQALKTLKRPRDAAGAFYLIKDDKDDSDRVIEIAQQIARQLMRDQETGSAPDDPAWTQALSHLSGERLLMGLMRARQMLSSNVSYPQVVETMFLNLVEDSNS